jgi:hypothetical protein
MYNLVRERERERERERIPFPIAPQTHFLLWNVGILEFYEDTSIMGDSSFLQQLIHCLDHAL